MSPLSQTKPFKRKGSLNPIRQKSSSMGGKHLSGSIDAQLHMRGLSHPMGPHTMSMVHPAPVSSRRQSLGQVPVGWAGTNSFHNAPRAHGMASIQGLMQKGLPTSPYASVQDDLHMTGDNGSTTSVTIRQEMFTMPVSGSPSPQGPSPQGSVGPSPHASNAHVRSGENFKVDPISGGELSHKRHRPYPNQGHTGHNHSSHRSQSLSAKPMRSHSLHDGQLPPEMTNSVGRMYVGLGTEHPNHMHYGNETGSEVPILDIKT